MRRFVAQNGLGLFFGAIFLVTVIGQAFVGHADFNHLQASSQNAPVSLARYVTSSDFGADVLENWQSEYLQFSLYIFGTVWLIQRGSPESKNPGDAGPGTEQEQLLGAHAQEGSPSSDFWNRTLQNWQSEFLAVGSMAVLAVYLRQRGSPESKPVGAAHDATGVEGG